MTDYWHAAKDLVGVPGMERWGSSRAIRHAAKWYGWQTPKEGVYTPILEAGLPATAQDYFAQGREKGGTALPFDTAAAGAPPASPPGPAAPLFGAAAERLDARLWFIGACTRWRAERGLGLAGEAAFCAAYAAGEVAAPESVRRLYPSLTDRVLRGWRAALAAGGVAALAPRRRGAGTGIIDSEPELGELIEALVLDRPHTSAKHVMRALRARFDRDLPSYRTVQRWIERWRRENARALSAVADPDRHRSLRMPAGGDAAAGIERLNQLWELDSTPADVLCTDGRHAVIGAIDVFSRRAHVLIAPTSRSIAIAALLRRCLLAWGVPEAVRTDEGADYTSIHVTRVLADLGIAHDRCRPYSPERKPFIERFLGRLSRDLFEQLPGYAGHSVADARAIRSRKSFAARRGDDSQMTFNVSLTAAELQAACDAWLAGVYEREPHQGLGGRSPFELAAAQPIRVIDDERALDILLAEAPGHGWRVVRKKGVPLDGTHYIAAELGPLVGERVHIRLDPADAGRVWVFDTGGTYLCEALSAERAGVDRAEIAAQMRRQAARADAEARAHARELKRRVRPETAIDEILAQARAENENVVAFPAPSHPHESAGLAAAAAAAAPPATSELTPEDSARAREAVAAMEARTAEWEQADELTEEDVARTRAAVAASNAQQPVDDDGLTPSQRAIQKRLLREYREKETGS